MNQISLTRQLFRRPLVGMGSAPERGLSLTKQLFRKPTGLFPTGRSVVQGARGPRGVGQLAASANTACSNWVPLTQSDPMWPSVLQAVQQAGFTLNGTNPPVVNGAWHFTFSASSVPAGSVMR